ncbi:MAG: hypothetical protein KAQ62_20800 [Cyclobacteriaceae bacterium]|nr:hypothetical protein [Cyclobacteriaceae bacterium]MCK5371019.1 hypothetical protein [Cyclobacteriaceae bacterium]
MEEVLIPLIVFGSMFAVVYVFLTTRNKERLALIEKGADATLFKSGPGKSVFGIVVLNIALMAIGIGIGVLLASLLSQNGMDEEVAFPAMIFIGGGLGLLAGFFATRKFKDDEKE